VSNEIKLGDDLLVGVPDIAEFLDQPRRRVQWWVDQRLIPVKKIGSVWTSRKSELNQHFTCGKADAA
jgi:hypothetical protein